MDSMSSCSGYGRMKEFEERMYRQKTRKRITIISISTFLLLVIIIGVTVAAVANKHNNSSNQRPSPKSTSSNSIKALCTVARYPDSCYSSISSAKGSNETKDPLEFFKLSLQVAIEALKNFDSSSSVLQVEDDSLQAAVRDCKELFDDAIDRLHDSLALLQQAKGEKFLTSSEISDLRTWISAAITDQQTCLDGFEGAARDVLENMEAAMVSATQFTSNSLAIATKILAKLENLDGFSHRRLLASTASSQATWLSSLQRRALLQDSSPLEPNVTVAKDGSGQFRTIKEALDSVPKKNSYQFVIYVKEGVYEEIVSVGKDRWNVTMIGDGMYKTIVTGSLNSATINSTKLTATFTAIGRGFMARDMGFRNTAGPENHQAVALRATSDHAIFYRCSFDAFQDTLFVHSLRQFYRECDIIGTVDFIFGDAAAVLQDCSIRPRQPMPDQKNTITAQGRTDPNENTGIVIQRCTISPHGNVTVPTYLGRPWKDYSTTIIMQSEIGGMVDPLGWLPWTDGTVPPDTIYHAEYQNSGPGSDVTGRVTWPGYRPAISRNEATKYGVDNFIQAGDWLTDKGIEFESTV